MYGPRSSALELDAADGVIDGRYYGAPIVGANYRGQTHPMVAARSQQEALALDAADGVIDGNYFGSRVGVAAGTEARRIALREPVCIVPNQHTASSLDGKDGKKDGRFYGIKIAVQGSQQSPVVAVPDQHTASQLDSQDGRKDGRFHGLPIAIMNSSAPIPPAPAPVMYAAPAPAPVMYEAPMSYHAPAPVMAPIYDTAYDNGQYGGKVVSVEYIDHGAVGDDVVQPYAGGYATPINTMAPMTTYSPSVGYNSSPLSYGSVAPVSYGSAAPVHYGSINRVSYTGARTVPTSYGGAVLL